MEAIGGVVPGLVERLAPAAPDPVARLASAAGVPDVVARLLLARGVSTAEEAARFFRPDESGIHDPFLLAGVGEAADLLLSAARGGRRIVVFGDYDVDGVTAVAQLKAALFRVGAPALSFLPHRIKDGYGLRPETVRRVVADLAPSVIVTVDCGITARHGVACARAAGVDVVVTDHHSLPADLPDGAVVVHPDLAGAAYPCPHLSGSGVAFKLAEAIATRARVGLAREALLRAASLGTIADLVPLSGENRAIAALGLSALSRPRAPGLAALLEAAGIAPGHPPTSEEIAFRVAPRLNAAGRIDTADLALAVFEERDAGRGREIARELCLRNAERQTIERRVFREARDRVARHFEPERDALIVEGDSAWHRGVLGIAAARLAREYNRPALLFALEGDRASCSGRSIPGVPLHDTLKEIRHRFLDFGGHDQAVGGSLPAAAFPAFREEARALFAERVPRESLLRRELAEAELPVEAISEELLSHLERLEPHGAGNPRPVFSCDAARPAGPFRPLGENGWRGRLEAGRGGVDAVCWDDGARTADLLGSAEALEIRYRLSRSRWTGRPEIEIVDARSRGEGTLPSP